MHTISNTSYLLSLIIILAKQRTPLSSIRPPPSYIESTRMNNHLHHALFRSSSIKNSSIVPFLLGAVSTLSFYWIRNSHHNYWKKKQENIAAEDAATTATYNEDTDIFDNEKLPNRMLRKAEAVIQLRTNRLLIVVERCTNDHNYSAILRTAEALGIATIYTIDPPTNRIVTDDEALLFDTNQKQNKIAITEEEKEIKRMHHIFAKNAQEWLQIRDFATAEECVACCREQGYQLWVTDLSQQAEALELYSKNPNDRITIPNKIAVVYGTESVGVSNYMLEQADKRIYLPLRGFADSLNLSVSTALVTQALFFLDPTLIGSISEHEKKVLRTRWYTKLATQRILTPKQKKEQKQLASKIKKCESIQTRMQNDTNYHVQIGEQKKLEEWSSYQQRLDQINALVDPGKVQEAVQEWIDDPPKPITDLRRADMHRVAFVGRNTRSTNKEHWKNMVATSNQGTIEGITANEFRRQMEKIE